VTADMQSMVACRFVSDAHEIVPSVDDPHYIERLRDICTRHDIRLVVPLIDTELQLLARHRDAFGASGVTLLISSPETVETTFDKRRTHGFFVANGIATPRLYPAECLDHNDIDFPVMVKPACGSGSVGASKAASARELAQRVESMPDAMVQEFIAGDEYTLDILVDFRGTVRSVVPRKRLAVRAGEVSTGVTVKHDALIAEGRRVAELLSGARGPITLQCFVTGDGDITFIEINPRFGGGFPLSAAAGADFSRWIVEWVLGCDPPIGLDAWQDGLYMLRYDEGLFVTGGPLP
jgi:carbamoyl-phosphate synthase large subunit